MFCFRSNFTFILLAKFRRMVLDEWLQSNNTADFLNLTFLAVFILVRTNFWDFTFDECCTSNVKLKICTAFLMGSKRKSISLRVTHVSISLFYHFLFLFYCSDLIFGLGDLRIILNEYDRQYDTYYGYYSKLRKQRRRHQVQFFIEFL